MYRAADALDPDTYLDLATAVYAEMALAGITCVGEFHYLHHARNGRPYDDPNVMGATLIEAARRAGIRITLLDACYLWGGLDRRLPSGPQERFSDGDVEGWRKRVDELVSATVPGAGADEIDRVKAGAAIHSVRAVDPDSMASVAEWARGRDVPLHLHLSEQRSENEQCMDALGMSPSEVVADRGVLGPNTTAVHATHVTPLDVELLGGSRTNVCMCPTTERDLGDGIGPASILRQAGASLSLGTDSHAVVDLFEEARAVELDERLAARRRGLHRADDLLRAATEGGARSLGWDSGRIAPGAPADVAVVGLDSVRMAGAVPDDLVGHLVFAASAADVTDVIVGGTRVVAGGRHLAIEDVSQTLSDAIGRVLP
jgi:formiminoglutamate deiminase